MCSLPVRGKTERLPIKRIILVSRNYHAHAVEMGRPVDKSVEVPFYFTKAPGTMVEFGATVAYPPGTKNYHFEMALVVAVGKAGFRVSEAAASRRRVAGLRLCPRPGNDAPRPATYRPRKGPTPGFGQGRSAVVGGLSLTCLGRRPSFCS